MNIDFSDFYRISFRGAQNEFAQSFNLLQVHLISFFLSMLPTLEITYHLYSSVRPGRAWRVLAGTRERLLFSIATSNNFSIATLDYGL